MKRVAFRPARVLVVLLAAGSLSAATAQDVGPETRPDPETPPPTGGDKFLKQYTCDLMLGDHHFTNIIIFYRMLESRVGDRLRPTRGGGLCR